MSKKVLIHPVTGFVFRARPIQGEWKVDKARIKNYDKEYRQRVRVPRELKTKDQ